MKNQAIIFDLDGTLWDATEQLTKIWNQVFFKRGLDTKLSVADLRGIMGMNIEETGEFLFPTYTHEEQMSILKQCAQEHIEYLYQHGATLFCSEEELEKLCETYDLYIVSNCPSGYIEAFLNAHHFEKYFQDYEMSGRTKKSKGENIKLVMERNGIQNCFYVGDTQKDEIASKEAGIPFVFASYGFGTAQAPNRVIQNFSELVCE